MTHPTSKAALSILEEFEPVIGLEVHCQLNTRTKLFCRCENSFGSSPNAETCPTCLGHPGVLPILNKQVVLYAAQFAMAVDATIHHESVFARKHYFYPDLPKGYQVTQYDQPFCAGGAITTSTGEKIALTRAHLEEDAGKNIHGETSSFVDLNRAGTPLIEIVSEPVMHTPAAASDYLKSLRSLVRYLGISDGNLDEGSFRCDANVSVRKRGVQTFGTRAEIKNLNSFRNIEKAIEYEIIRQVGLIKAGGQVQQQTLLFDPALGVTKPMRSKEDSQDYRYFPEPDLRPLWMDEALIADARSLMPELPVQKRLRFKEEYGLTDYDTDVLTNEKALADYYEDCVAAVHQTMPEDKTSPKIVANWVHSELLRVIHEKDWDIKACPISAQNLASLVCLILNGTISGKIAKVVFAEMIESPDKQPKEIVKEKGLLQISDESVIEKVVDAVIAANPGQVELYRSGKDRLFGFFVGQVLKESKGKFNPQVVNDLLKQKLS